MTDDEQTLELKILRHDVDRLRSDWASEKGTRARANADLHARLDIIDGQQRKLEKIIYMGVGGLGVLQFLISLIR